MASLDGRALAGSKYKAENEKNLPVNPFIFCQLQSESKDGMFAQFMSIIPSFKMNVMIQLDPRTLVFWLPVEGEPSFYTIKII